MVVCVLYAYNLTMKYSGEVSDIEWGVFSREKRFQFNLKG